MKNRTTKTFIGLFVAVACALAIAIPSAALALTPEDENGMRNKLIDVYNIVTNDGTRNAGYLTPDTNVHAATFGTPFDAVYLKPDGTVSSRELYYPVYDGSSHELIAIAKKNTNNHNTPYIIDLDKEVIAFLRAHDNDTLVMVAPERNALEIGSASIAYYVCAQEWLKVTYTPFQPFDDYTYGDFSSPDTLDTLLLIALRDEINQGNPWILGSNGWYYFGSDNQLARDTWLNLSGNWYLFGSDALMQTGWVESQDAWYYLDPYQGNMQTGWFSDGSHWYYSNEEGALLAGWRYLDNSWYYLNEQADGTWGSLQTGWVNLDGTWYLLASSGEMLTGWQSYNGNWFYLYPSGELATNTTIDGWSVNSAGIWNG